ncbi:MAG: efflux RND transporter periplasmic adaptor subunit [Alphaproteobacteria bacterium]|nr:efflux RND transporter periplasmic adaptor subunit [Alphaproteobacteria bacterium]MDP6516175.1 efflux RND transporter periplasmic adaptor subunit [Alphaproteobacteria bacterium]
MSGTDSSEIRIAPAVVNNLGVRTAAVSRGELERHVRAVGYIGYDESKISHVHLRAEGWIERLAVKAVGEHVAKGQILFEIYSPTLVNAQAELLQAYATGGQGLIEASWRRLQSLAVSDRQMHTLVDTGRVAELVTVYASQQGVVSDLGVAEGMYAEPSTMIMTLADLSTVWLLVEVFEQQAGWISPGLPAEVRLPYAPGRIWQGRVEYVYPEVDPRTRTLKVRLKFDNPGEALKPNMFADATIFATAKTAALSIPRESLIRTGGSVRVVLAAGEGRFRPTEVVAGIESGDRMEILSGLSEGDRVVTSAQFLIDSESSLAASFSRFEEIEMASTEDSAPTPIASGTGVVNAVMAAERKVNLTHGPIPAINWPKMTMDFSVRAGVDIGNLEAGDEIMFDLEEGEAGNYVIIAVEPVK